MSKEYVKKTKLIHLGAIVADSDALLYALWKLTHAIKITAIRLGVNTACAAADTNYNTFAVKNGATTVASIANGPEATGTSFTAGAFTAMTLVAAAAELAADDVLTLDITKTGNGLALAGAILQIEYYDYNA